MKNDCNFDLVVIVYILEQKFIYFENEELGGYEK